MYPIPIEEKRTNLLIINDGILLKHMKPKFSSCKLSLYNLFMISCYDKYDFVCWVINLINLLKVL